MHVYVRTCVLYHMNQYFICIYTLLDGYGSYPSQIHGSRVWIRGMDRLCVRGIDRDLAF